MSITLQKATKTGNQEGTISDMVNKGINPFLVYPNQEKSSDWCWASNKDTERPSVRQKMDHETLQVQKFFLVDLSMLQGSLRSMNNMGQIPECTVLKGLLHLKLVFYY